MFIGICTFFYRDNIVIPSSNIINNYDIEKGKLQLNSTLQYSHC